MDRVILQTKDGGYVTGGKIPPFNEPPDVLLWGDRVFQYNVTDDEHCHIYVEVFYFVLTQLT